MRRWILTGLPIVALMAGGAQALIDADGAFALPGVAGGQAAASKYEGAVVKRGAPEFKVTFTVVTVNNKPVRLKNFRFQGLAAQCDGGATIYAKGSIDRIRVRSDRTFAKTVKRNGKKVRVAGKVRRNGTVPGTIRASGNFGQQTNCNSGLVEWKAAPQ